MEKLIMIKGDYENKKKFFEGTEYEVTEDSITAWVSYTGKSLIPRIPYDGSVVYKTDENKIIVSDPEFAELIKILVENGELDVFKKQFDNSEEIKEGSVVVLKSGSLEMTVNKITENDKIVCSYFYEGEFKSTEFKRHELNKK